MGSGYWGQRCATINRPEIRWEERNQAPDSETCGMTYREDGAQHHAYLLSDLNAPSISHLLTGCLIDGRLMSDRILLSDMTTLSRIKLGADR